MRRLVPTALFGAVFMSLPTPALEPQPPDVSSLPARPELPDSLVMLDGSRVATKEEWFGKRRPELKELFQAIMYGRYPQAKPDIRARLVHEDRQAVGGKATLREFALVMTLEAPPVHVLVVTPNRPGPAPAFVGLNFAGNHTITTDPKVQLPGGWVRPNKVGVKDNRATDAGRGTQASVWPLETIVERGYALATAYYGDIIPDDPKVRGGLANQLPGAQAQRLITLRLGNGKAPAGLPLQPQPALLSGVVRRIAKLLVKLMLNATRPVAGGAFRCHVRLAQVA